LLFAIFNVFVRDVGQVVPVLLQLGFWFTPIVYLPSLLPERFVPLLRLNPMTPIVQSYQNVMVWHSAPAWPALAWVVALAVALLAMSLFVFRRASVELVDAL
jgi:lipopolysaccharide transport system permease protein